MQCSTSRWMPVSTMIPPQSLRANPLVAALGMLPNLLSFTRLFLGLLFPLLPERWRLWAFLAAALSDLLDGFTSRLLKVASGKGRYLDPIADKVFILGVVLTLTMEGFVTVPEVGLLGL